MKSTLKSKPKKAASAAPTQRGHLMNGAEVLVASLEREGVDTIFAYPTKTVTGTKPVRCVAWLGFRLE